MIKGIAFDKDGTLMKYNDFWMPVSKAAIKSILEKHGIEEDLTDDLMQSLDVDNEISGMFYSGTYADYAKAFNKTFRKKGYKVSVSRSEVSDAFSENISEGKIVPICDNMQKIFSDIKEEGIKTAVVTTDNPQITERCLKELGIYEYIDRIYADDGVHPTKPNPYYMKCFCKEFGFKTSEVMMVGDSLLDMEFAKKSKAIGFGVSRIPEKKGYLLQKANIVSWDVSYVLEGIDYV